MNKILKIILGICSFLLGCFLILCSIAGIILCFYSLNTFTTILTIIFTVAFFVGGILLVYFAIRGFKPKSQNNVAANHIAEQSRTENTAQNIKCQNLNTPSPTDGNMPACDFRTEQRQSSNSQRNTKEPEVEVPSASDVYIEDNDYGIRHADNSQITDEELPYLIRLGYEHALEYENSSSNPKFHRTAQEEELSFRFSIRYESEIHTLENNFETLYRDAAREQNIDEKILKLNEAIDAFEKAKRFCYSKGKGGTIYFQDMWEYLHNSRNSCFSYVDNINNSLNEAVIERDVIIPGILNAIYEKEFILQKDLYKMFPTIERRHLQYVVQRLEHDNCITKTKHGNSYELRIKN